MTTPCLTDAPHVLRDCDSDITVCLVCGVTTGPTEDARVASLLAHWARQTPDWWPGVERTHTALLAHLSSVFGADEARHGSDRWRFTGYTETEAS